MLMVLTPEVLAASPVQGIESFYTGVRSISNAVQFLTGS